MENSSEVIPRKFICCPICEDEYKQPKFLPCLHTFCQKCIQQYIEQNVEEDGCFGCPICYTEASIERGDLNDLPDNFFIRRLSGTIALPTIKDNGKHCSVCKNAGKKKDASKFCANCDDYLCGDCRDNHRRESETLSHKIEDISESDEDKLDRPVTPITPQIISKCCDNYDSLDIGAMFCVDCDNLVCAECHVSSHETHRCAELTAVAQNFESKINEPLAQLTEDGNELSVALKQLSHEETTAINQRNKLRRDIKKRSKYLTELVTDYERLLLNEVDRRYENNTETIRQYHTNINLHLSSIQAVTDLSEKLLSYGSVEEKVVMRKKIGLRVRELCEHELPSTEFNTEEFTLSEPETNINMISEMFGELNNKQEVSAMKRSSSAGNNTQIFQKSIDSGQGSDILENNEVELFGEYSSESESDILSVSNQSGSLRSVQTDLPKAEPRPVVKVAEPQRELLLPPNIQRDCIKGMGVNENGDIIIGSVSTSNQMVYILEKRGILRGQTNIEQGWNIHSVASDGKVALMATKGDNRRKVRILRCDGSLMFDVYFESYGMNHVTANNKEQIIVASNRFGRVKLNMSKSSVSGGNITIFDKDGLVITRITNEDLAHSGHSILEKPTCISVDKQNNFYVSDTGTHSVSGFDSKGNILFYYKKDETDMPYSGPDSVCVDKIGNVIVADRRSCRIDILNDSGQLHRSLHTQDQPKFVSVTPDKLIMTANAEGTIRFYEYL